MDSTLPFLIQRNICHKILLVGAVVAFKNVYCLVAGFYMHKVHLTPKYYFLSNKSLHLFETHCAFLPV